LHNGQKIDPPKDIALEEGLIGLNAPMLMHNRHHEVEMSERALGVRMTGCAGIELIALVLGQRAGYISNLAPWDYAPGGILMETLGLKMANITGEELALDGRELFIGGTPTAFQELIGDRKSINNRADIYGYLFFFCKNENFALYFRKKFWYNGLSSAMSPKKEFIN
jgi:fructose-1,6-bisphosphatase/inositol monophosphatase family enzyme